MHLLLVARREVVPGRGRLGRGRLLHRWLWLRIIPSFKLVNFALHAIQVLQDGAQHALQLEVKGHLGLGIDHIIDSVLFTLLALFLLAAARVAVATAA